MKILIAPDSFKESLTALEVATAIESGFKQVMPDAVYRKVPMADGGEGTLQSLVDATCGDIVQIQVNSPLFGRLLSSRFGISGDGKTAFIEMAEASGLEKLTPNLRNPLITTTYGTGELINAALDRGVEKIILGIGGSATNDGGMGVAQALGVKFLNELGEPLKHGGGQLHMLRDIDLTGIDARLKDVEIVVACDVDNPLCGKDGASFVFSPQKGANELMAKQLDDGLYHYADVIHNKMGIDIRDIKGSGAAGGLGGGAIAFLGATLRSGIDIVTDAVGLEREIKDSDIVITAEGRMDSQTLHGKTPIGVAKLAKKYNKPVVGFAGCLGEGVSAVHEHGIDAVFPTISKLDSLDKTLKNASVDLERTARNAAAMIGLYK